MDCGTRGKKQLVDLSRKILEELQAKRRTTRNHITDAILNGERVVSGELKNIQRRVYDAINVLEALEVVVKDGNFVKYNSAQRVELKASEQLVHRRNVQRKRKQLREMFRQYIALRNLLRRNRALSSCSIVHLPVLLVSASGSVQVEVGNKTVQVESSTPLQVVNDTQLLAQMLMHEVPTDDLDVPSGLLSVLQLK